MLFKKSRNKSKKSRFSSVTKKRRIYIIVAVFAAIGVYALIRSNAQSPPFPLKNFKVMSWNVGQGGRYLHSPNTPFSIAYSEKNKYPGLADRQSERIANVIAFTSPDVVFLQETYDIQVLELKKYFNNIGVNYNLYFAAAVPINNSTGTTYGNALATKYPITEAWKATINPHGMNGFDGRSAAMANLNIWGYKTRVVGTHLTAGGSNSGQRVKEADCLLRSPTLSTTCSTPGNYAGFTILGGDLNEEEGSLAVEYVKGRGFIRGTSSANSPRTCCRAYSSTQDRKYDHIFNKNVPSNFRYVSQTIVTGSAIGVSDHLPILSNYYFY